MMAPLLEWISPRPADLIGELQRKVVWSVLSAQEMQPSWFPLIERPTIPQTADIDTRTVATKPNFNMYST